MTTTEHAALAEALDRLADIAGEAGLDPAAARDEGLRIAAALAESVPGAAPGWAAAAGLATTDLGAVNAAFFDAASRGRRWRANPTDQLEALAANGHARAIDYAVALTEVASAAVMLGTAPIWVIANASAASAMYLSAARLVGAPGGPGLPSAFPSVFPSALPSANDLQQTGRSVADRIGGVGPGLSGGPQPGIGSQPDGIRAGVDVVNPVAAQADPPAAPTAEPEPAEPEKSVEELLGELDAMIGLGRVKREIHRQVALLTVEKMRLEAGLKPTKLSRHLIFVGNPGTGKTTVARLIGAIYKALGLLKGGQLIEVDRSELVAGYVGQTAMKTAELCAKAVGGVLFIDEAYALTGDQFAQEAVNTLVKEMEDHRQDLVVIVAGYPGPMVGFIAQNPGLASRFTTTIEFDDYSDDELLAILDSIADGADYELTEDAQRRVRMTLEATPRTPAFGNGRFSRNVFEHAIGRHAWRLKDATAPTVEELRQLTADDFIEHLDDASGDASAQDGDAHGEGDDEGASEGREVDGGGVGGTPDGTSDVNETGSTNESDRPDPTGEEPA